MLLSVSYNSISVSGDNNIGAGWPESLAGVLGQCAALAHLDLYGNKIEAVGAGSFAGALGQCTSLLAQARQSR